MSLEYYPLITSALYSAISTYGKDRTSLRVFAQDLIASLNRKGVIPNEEVEEALNSAYEYIDREIYGSSSQREREEPRRYGQPRTEEERLERHYERYGTTELPPRGTGLQESSVSQTPTSISLSKQREFERKLLEAKSRPPPYCPICHQPMKRVIGNVYQCPRHPTQTTTIG